MKLQTQSQNLGNRIHHSDDKALITGITLFCGAAYRGKCRPPNYPGAFYFVPKLRVLIWAHNSSKSPRNWPMHSLREDGALSVVLSVE